VQATLAPGETVQLGSYTLVAHGIQSTNQPGVRVVDGLLTVNGEPLKAEKQYFTNFENQPSTKVGLRSTPFEDLYVVLSGWDGDGPTARVSVALFINPLVSWIWTGGVLLLLGTLVALWPAPQPALRRATARMPSGALGATP
jgi:cytochrome c-type biogenesis protein CcmF